MEPRYLLVALVLWAQGCVSPDVDGLTSAADAAPSRPNVIVVLTDDQGYGDVGAHGNPMIRTPALDQLWGESVRLTDFHVDPTCAPTRAALMTGRYSTRSGVWHTIMGRSLMDSAEVTLAESLRASGYRTGMFGKWHLGDSYPLRPQDQGFDQVVWHHGGGVGQGPDYWGNDYFDDTYEVNGEWQPFEGYCTDVWFREAQAFIEEESDQPFFAYVSTNAPHHPYLVDESYAQPYLDAGVEPTMARFYGMIENIDENVGALRQQLVDLGIAENTILVFMTDNGTAAGVRASKGSGDGEWSGFDAGMRGAKGSEFDGGHRVPCFVHWPGGGVVGGRDVDELAAHIDLLPTIAELCSAPSVGERALDGSSFAAALRGTGPAPTDRTLLVHSQRIEHPQKWRKSSVMTERWRLVNGDKLFEIETDPGQRTDVAAANPDVVEALRHQYDAWWGSFEDVHQETVRIGLGAAQANVPLMSHDWHEESGPTPWHQNHVRRGTVANGTWALNAEHEGDYEITLFRWPEQLERAMDVEHAAIQWTLPDGSIQRAEQSVEPRATRARFVVRLPAGPVDLRTTLRRPGGEEHGAYFATVAVH
ncbi:MAG: arylsulfatase A-like enzyme [Planctomycetota bacterium]|jgi:arylsulfatase A-like enzyme